MTCPGFYRRGLTLVEVLAAVVLLAVIAGTCASMLRTASTALADDTVTVQTDELAEFARGTMDSDEESHTTVSDWLRSGGDQLEMPWPTSPTELPVTLRRLVPSDAGIDHAWVEFACGPTRVWRWISVESDSVTERTP